MLPDLPVLHVWSKIKYTAARTVRAGFYLLSPNLTFHSGKSLYGILLHNIWEFDERQTEWRRDPMASHKSHAGRIPNAKGKNQEISEETEPKIEIFA